MRFDDSLTTVLAADSSTGFGAQSAWRQLLDLTARRRVPDMGTAIDRLRELRPTVPTSVRAASGRALLWGEPPVAVVALFAEEELAIAAPVLRAAKIDVAEWRALLPHLSPAKRAVLRHRSDLPDEVVRALATFGATDFVLGHDGPQAKPEVEATSPVSALLPDATAPAEAMPAEVSPPPAPLHATTPFVAVGEVARTLPVVAEALRQATDPAQFEIADLVARIDAFRRDRPATDAKPRAVPAAERWQFETDALGVIRWVEGVARGPLIGLALTRGERQGVAQIDPAIGGTLRVRQTFRDVRLEVGGESSATGEWRLSGVPRFDRATGRFTGLAGIARRPQREEGAAPVASASDSLRQLVHELRTPTNAIAGFAELIGTELLGPVPPIYRDRATLIQEQTAGLVAAIDDLDTAARIDGKALDLRSSAVDLAPLLTRIVEDLRPLAVRRRATLSVESSAAAMVEVDDRAVARLLDRLFTTVLAVAEPGERLRVQVATKTRTVRVHVTRPRALRVSADETLLAIDGTPGDDGPLLGIDFTLRLVRNLAGALDGSLAITPDRLTLRLPAMVLGAVERTAA